MIFQLFKDQSGAWHWRLLSVGRNIIAASVNGCVAKTDCLRNILLVKSAINADIEEAEPIPIN
jgi:uncharacterized protein YegP (UPF0339 family)